MPIGDLNWTQRGGVLSLTERWQLTLGALRKHISLRRQAASAGAADPANALNRLSLRALEQIEQPWDALAFAAATAAQELQPPWLTNHVWRTYAWGSLLALEADLRYDKSLFFSACMLHDLGLTPHASAPGDQCFTLRSARAANDILRAAGASETQLRCVAQAITLHLNPDVDVEQGVEAHLVQAGAGLDVVGQRSQDVPAALRQAVIGRYPRLDFKHCFCHCMRIESDRAPQSRAGWYVRRLGFLDLIGRSPFDE